MRVFCAFAFCAVMAVLETHAMKISKQTVLTLDEDEGELVFSSTFKSSIVFPFFKTDRQADTCSINVGLGFQTKEFKFLVCGVQH